MFNPEKNGRRYSKLNKKKAYSNFFHHIYHHVRSVMQLFSCIGEKVHIYNLLFPDI